MSVCQDSILFVTMVIRDKTQVVEFFFFEINLTLTLEKRTQICTLVPKMQKFKLLFFSVIFKLNGEL